MQKTNFRAFTLVELIVVITIVGILSTVGFVSYSGYLTGARDSNRISQMVKLSDSLQVYSTTKSLPLPDNYVEVDASGSLIAYQGEVGVDVLETIDYTNGGADPKDDSYYTYFLTKDRRSMQLMAMMEEQKSVAQINPINTYITYAVDYTDRFPKVYGRKLGIFTEIDTNTPIHQLSAYASTAFDVVSETGQFISHISDDEKLEGTGAILQAMIPDGSCKRIKQTGGASGNGIYIINPGGTGDTSVYCDMETAGGGWTMVARTYSGSTATNFGWLDSFGAPENYTEAYSMGDASKEIFFNEIMAAHFDQDTLGSNVGIVFSVDNTILKNDTTSAVLTSGCEKAYGTGDFCSAVNYWGRITDNSQYYFHDTGANVMSGLNKDNWLLPNGARVGARVFVK